MSLAAALDDLRARGTAEKAAQMAAYHKVDRPYLGVSNPDIYEAVAAWRKDAAMAETMAQRLALAHDLWATNIHEAMIAAAKLLVQARIRDLEPETWAEIASWLPSCDAWAVADHAAGPGSRRLRAVPARLDEVEAWTRSDHLWTKRAALVFTLPWTKSNHPTEAEEAERDRILGWAAGYADDREWFIQKAIAWWVRELSKHDVPRATRFLADHGSRLKPFARKEAGKYLP